MKRRNQNWPSPFPGRMSQETTKPGFSFFGLILCCSVFCYGCMFALLCLFQFFTTKPRNWLATTSPKWPILCQVERNTLTQSINYQSDRHCFFYLLTSHSIAVDFTCATLC